MARRPNPACHLFLQINCYWNTAILLHLHIVHGCFHTTVAELDTCNREYINHKTQNIFTLGLLQEIVCWPQGFENKTLHCLNVKENECAFSSLVAIGLSDFIPPVCLCYFREPHLGLRTFTEPPFLLHIPLWKVQLYPETGRSWRVLWGSAFSRGLSCKEFIFPASQTGSLYLSDWPNRFQNLQHWWAFHQGRGLAQ